MQLGAGLIGNSATGYMGLHVKRLNWPIFGSH